MWDLTDDVWIHTRCLFHVLTNKISKNGKHDSVFQYCLRVVLFDWCGTSLMMYESTCKLFYVSTNEIITNGKHGSLFQYCLPVVLFDCCGNSLMMCEFTLVGCSMCQHIKSVDNNEAYTQSHNFSIFYFWNTFLSKSHFLWIFFFNVIFHLLSVYHVLVIFLCMLLMIVGENRLLIRKLAE